MHRIDRHIFTQLLTHEIQRFSDLKPPGVEGNTLTYRLKVLQKDNLVAKTSDGLYRLTEEGRFFTDRLNFYKFTPRQMPRPVSLIIVRRNNEWLLHKRFIHPLRDLTGLPHANIKSGESIITSAERRIKEMTGLGVELVYRGGGFLTFYRDGELESFNQVNILENINKCEEELRPPARDIVTGTYFWEKSPDFTQPTYIPSLHAIKQYIDGGIYPFFFELTYNLN